MLTLRKSDERGHADHGWLDTRHSFSFASYYDAEHMGFRTLRVINQDTVQGGAGFPTHPHANMEIISYVVSGELAHRDSMGNVETIKAGEFQVMTAGTGITHSEFNSSESEPVHFLQIWITPAQNNLSPRYEQRQFSREEKINQLRLVATNTKDDDSLLINQDVRLYLSRLEPGNNLEHTFAEGRAGWLQLISGSVIVNNQTIKPGDGLAIEEVRNLSIEAETESEFLFFDLA
jgi:redox-sensitive bicupin YhaK (pirin superfamily)